VSNTSPRRVFHPGEVAYFYFPHIDTWRLCPETGCTHEKLYGSPPPDEKTVLLVLEGKGRPMLVMATDGPHRYTLLKIESLKPQHAREPGRFLDIQAENLRKTSVVGIGKQFCLPGQLAIPYRSGSIDRLKFRDIYQRHRALLGYGPSPPVRQHGQGPA